MTEVNGKEIVSLRPDVPARAFCDSCKFSNLLMVNNTVTTICRKRPPTVVGSPLVTKTQDGFGAQGWFTNTLWPGVTKDDWCGEHEPDPRGVRSPVPANDSVLATPS